MSLPDKYVKVEALSNFSRDEFRPYGQIFGLADELPFEEREDFQYFRENVVLGPSQEKTEEVTAGLFILKKRFFGQPLTQLERHPKFSETFVTFDGGPILFALAPTDNSQPGPDLDMLRFVLIDSHLVVHLHKGTWHWPPMPLREDTRVFLLAKGELFSPTNPTSGTDFSDLPFNLYPVI